MFADTHPTGVLFTSPYLTKSVTENDVNAYEESKLFENPYEGKLWYVVLMRNVSSIRWKNGKNNLQIVFEVWRKRT